MLLLRGRPQVVLRDGLTLAQTCHRPLVRTSGAAVQEGLLFFRLIAFWGRVFLNIIFITCISGTKAAQGHK